MKVLAVTHCCVLMSLVAMMECHPGGYSRGGGGSSGGTSYGSGGGTASGGGYGSGGAGYGGGSQSSAADALKTFYNTQQGNNYNFGYNVEDPVYNNYQSRQESGDPKGQVTGSYSLVDPDGSQRTVEYVADWVNGFRATVRDRNGVTQHGYNTDDGYSSGNQDGGSSGAYGAGSSGGSSAAAGAGSSGGSSAAYGGSSGGYGGSSGGTAVYSGLSSSGYRGATGGAGASRSY